jgi:hypothetical protein
MLFPKKITIKKINSTTKRALTLIIALCFISNVFAQFTSSNNSPYNSINYLLNNVLKGNGMSISNVTFTGNINQIGFFTEVQNNILLLDSGIVLSTGNINTLPNDFNGLSSTQIQTFNNTPNDSDIYKLINSIKQTPQGPLTINCNSINDLAFLEFDFVPSGDIVELEYVFSSEEYSLQYCNAQDEFGIFVSGPNINGPFSSHAINIATIGNSNPPIYASIYNINYFTSNCFWSFNNPNLFTYNTSVTGYACNGLTKKLTARVGTLCGETYHMKIAIADAIDRTYDSALLLKAHSLNSSNTKSTFKGSLESPADSLLLEGCNDGSITIQKTMHVDSVQTFFIHINDPNYNSISNQNLAFEGVDFDSIPNQITIPAGLSEISIPIHAIQDGINEATEKIIFAINNPCNITLVDSFNMYIGKLDSINFQLPDIHICIHDTAILKPLVSNIPRSAQYQWSTGDTAQSIHILPQQDTTQITLTISSFCNNLFTTKTCKLIRDYPPQISLSLMADTNVFYDKCKDTVTIKISLQHPAINNLSFSWGYSTNATINQDFQTIGTFPNVLNFNVGDSVKYFKFIVLDDFINETVTKQIHFNMSNFSLNTCGNNQSALDVYLKDYNQPFISINYNAYACKDTSVEIFANLQHPELYHYLWTNNNSQTNSAIYTINNSGNQQLFLTDTVCHIPTTYNYYFEFSQGDTISIVSQPQNQFIPEGDTAHFTCLATGNLNEVTWQKYNVNGWEDLVEDWHYINTNNLVLSVTDVNITDNNTKYRCILYTNSCNEISEEASLMVWPTNIKNDGSLQKISISPNPFKHEVTINSNFKNEKVLLVIKSMTGSVLYSNEINMAPDLKLNLSQLPNGIYELGLISNKIQTHTFIVKSE